MTNKIIKIFFVASSCILVGVIGLIVLKKQPGQGVALISQSLVEATPSPVVGTPAHSAISEDFDLDAPDGYKITSTTPDESQELYTIENSDGESLPAGGQGFQIFVMPFDEPGPITEERIREELPDAVIDNPGRATLDGVETFYFYGNDEDIGETFEVWNVHGGRLFQVMGRKADETMIVGVLNTWRWR